MTAVRARSAVPDDPPGATAMADGGREVVHECVELGLGALGAGEVVGELGVVDVLLQVADAGLVRSPGRGIDHLAGRGLLRTGAGEIEAVVLAAGRGQQHGEIGHPLGGADRHDATAVAHLPHWPTLDE